MLQVGQVLSWVQGWSKRLDKSSVRCGLATCAGPKSPWNTYGRQNGALLQGVFYCGRSCLETALMAQLGRLRALPVAAPSNRIPLGLLMVARGWLTHEQVATALRAQSEAGTGQIGDWFERLGFATEQQVTSALGLQWGCPVTLAADAASVLPFAPIPLGILEAFQMMPLQYAAATNTLYIAFGQRVDHGALYAIENILDCRTQPCVAGRKAVANELSQMRQRWQPEGRELEFGLMRDFGEIKRVAVSYMLRLGTDEIRLTRVGEFIWLRLRVRKQFTDLLFRTEVKVQKESQTFQKDFPAGGVAAASLGLRMNPDAPAKQLESAFE